jgi:hypothetical protein
MTFSINVTQHNTLYAIMLNVVMLSVAIYVCIIMLNVVMLSLIVLSAVMVGWSLGACNNAARRHAKSHNGASTLISHEAACHNGASVLILVLMSYWRVL